MKYTIIVGSQRENSQSLKVGKFIESQILKMHEGSEVHLASLANSPIPFYDDSGEQENDFIIDLKKHLDESEAIILITPEWNGMASTALKNMLHHIGKRQFGHKPALLVSVSSGRGGAYPIAELRMNSHKNTFINYIPDQIIVRDVENVLNTEEPHEEDASDIYYRDRIPYTLNILTEYAKALKQVRDSGAIDYERYGNGM